MTAILEQLQGLVAAAEIPAGTLGVALILGLFGLMVVGLVLGQELAFVLGGAGVISTIGNVAPARMKEIVDLCAAGDWEAAAAANEALMPLMKGLFETSNPILVKEALKLLGFPVGGVRLPLVDATPAQSERLAAIMREVGVLDA